MDGKCADDIFPKGNNCPCGKYPRSVNIFDVDTG